MREEDKFRLVRMHLSSWDTLILHIKNPWIPMWWSAALPGLGHICQGSYIKGLVLMSWEILINVKANLNMAIFYTFTGRFEKAGEVLEAEWALFYGAVFFFSIFDVYRNCVESNNLARLERSQPRRYYRLMKLSAGGKNYLGRVNPWAAAAWSATLTGFGHLYNGRSFKALILLGWAVAVISLARVNTAVIATCKGQFHRAGELVDYQWLLFFPSIYVFAIWDSYNDAVEMNKLFAEAQKYHLRKEYGR